MKIAEQNIAAIQAFGYTESEARFLYIVATHSGYFIPRQFIAFTGAKWGKRSTHFAEKIESRGHAAWRKYPGIGDVYHLFAKRLYGEIGKENFRNRRRHSVEFIQTPLVLLDFVLAHQQHDYLETEPEKLRYFCEQLGIPRKHLPTKAYVGSSRTEPTLRYFVDKYPLFLDSSSLPSPVVTLSYIDPGHASIAGFKHHLQAYDALLRTLGDFHFLYISNTRAHFARATECFSSLVQLPPQVDVPVEILRYFRLRQAWKMQQYGTLDSDDVEWLQDATKRFHGGKYDACYSAWASGRVGELELRKEFVQAQRQRTVEFRTYFTGEGSRIPVKRTSFCASRLFAPFASPVQRSEVTANPTVARILNNARNAAKPRTEAGEGAAGDLWFYLFSPMCPAGSGMPASCVCPRV